MVYDRIGAGLLSTFDANGSFGLSTGLTNPAGIITAANAPRLTDIHTIPTTDTDGNTILFAHTGIDLSSYAAGASALGITTTVIHPELTVGNLIVSDVSVVLVVMLVALYPAMKAARLRPVEAIRHI